MIMLPVLPPKKIFKATAIVLAAAICAFCAIYFIDNAEPRQVRDCGIVESKSSDEVAIKNGSETQLYLNVRFKNAGFKSILCTPTTYFSKKKGDTVCFMLADPTHNPNKLIMLIGLIVLACAVIAGLFFILVLVN